MAAGGERRGLVEKIAGKGDHGGAPAGIVGGGDFTAVLGGDGVGAVERIVEAAPAGVRGVEGITGVVDGHHQLRPGDGGDLRIDALGLDLEIIALRQEVADLLQKTAVGGGFVRLAGAGAVPRVDFSLQFIAPGQELAQAGAEFSHHPFECRPERGGCDARAGGGTLFDEVAEHGRDLQAAKGNPGGGGHERTGCEWSRRCSTPYCLRRARGTVRSLQPSEKARPLVPGKHRRRRLRHPHVPLEDFVSHGRRRSSAAGTHPSRTSRPPTPAPISFATQMAVRTPRTASSGARIFCASSASFNPSPLGR